MKNEQTGAETLETEHPGAEEVETEVLDDTEDDDTVAPVQYEITSFGADYDVEGLVKRLQRDDILIPPFQRDYVWTQKMASRFVESLLLGLPVPGIFLARESESKKLLVIDGQQRLKTLRFFFEGVFNPDPEATTQRVFKLLGVQKRYEGWTYDTLDESDRIMLNDSIMHATIVKQDSPEGEQSSIYHIFERLNTSGRKLSPQQIRVAIYHGSLIDSIRELNAYEPWREVYGRRSRTLKDQELILRFLALHFDRSNYKSPMNEFLNDFAGKAMRKGSPSLDDCGKVFKNTIAAVYQAIGSKAFRPERALNAAMFDSVMVGVAGRLKDEPQPTVEEIRDKYNLLMATKRYGELISRATANEKNVSDRIDLSLKQFSQT